MRNIFAVPFLGRVISCYEFTQQQQKNFFFSGATAQNQAEIASLSRFQITHTHPVAPLHEWSARLIARYLHNTQQTQQTNIHALSAIRIPDPSNQTAADMRIRRHGHHYQPQKRWQN